MSDDLVAFLTARLDEDEATARNASGGTVIGHPGDWKPAPGGDEWEVHANLVDGDDGPDGDLEVLVALRLGLSRPPDVMGGYWGAVMTWQADPADPHAWVPEPQFRHMARHDPARALREVQAKRRILVFLGSIPQPEVSEPVLGWLAEVYIGHPDYRQEWAPGA